MVRLLAYIAAAVIGLLACVAAPAKAYDAGYSDQANRILRKHPVYVSRVMEAYGDNDVQAARRQLNDSGGALVVLPETASTGIEDTKMFAMKLLHDSDYTSVGMLIDGNFVVASRVTQDDMAVTIAEEVDEPVLASLAITVANDAAAHGSSHDVAKATPWSDPALQGFCIVLLGVVGCTAFALWYVNRTPRP